MLKKVGKWEIVQSSTGSLPISYKWVGKSQRILDERGVDIEEEEEEKEERGGDIEKLPRGITTVATTNDEDPHPLMKVQIL